MTFILPSFGASAISAVPASGGGGAVTNDYSLSLDGTNDYARLTGMTLSGAFTASFWFNPLSHAMGSGDLFMTKGYDANPHTSETDWKLDYASGGFRYSIFDRTQSWATKLEATHTFSFSANTWYHIMITYDGGTSTSGMGLFVDGVSKTLTTATQNPSFTGNNSTSATAVNVGNSSQWAGGKLTGLIDEVAFWETDQSANISSIYTGTAPIDLSGLSTAPNDWFRFENNANNEISGGSGSASLVNGPTYSSDAPGATSSFTNTYSLQYDGSNDYAEVTGLGLSGATSFSMWINPQASSNFYPLFHADSNGVYIDIAVGSFRAYLYDNTNGGYLTRSYGLSPSLNTWYHLAVTVDAGSTTGTGASASLKLYVNGAEVSSAGVTKSGSYTTFNSPSSNPLDIGARTASSTYANQLIDEVAIFGSELSASDITAIYNSGVPADLTSYSPVGWWRMGDNDSGTGTTITDQGSGGNDATLTNGPTFSTTVPS